MSPIRLTREELHEMAWTTAASRLAPKLGLSDVALRKRCKALHVPLPGARYWGLLHAGRPVTRDPQARWDRRHREDWHAWEGRPRVPYYDFTPTGVTSVEILGWPRPPGITHRFADSAARKVEARVAEIIVSARAHAAYLDEWRREQEVARANAEQEQARRRLEEEERRREQQRAEFLASLLARRRELDELASLLDSLPAGGASPFLAWCRARRDRLAGAVDAGAIEKAAETLGLFPAGSGSNQA